jgi:hypothetical protein
MEEHEYFTEVTETTKSMEAEMAGSSTIFSDYVLWLLII